MPTDQPDDLDLRSEYEKQAESVCTDSLTGLYNHGFFCASFEREVKRSIRDGTSFTLALIEVDSLHLYNKLYGHVKGDHAIKKIGGIISDNIRQVDLAARYSGAMFANLLIQADSAASLAVAERIRIAIEDEFLNKLTVSIGIASFPENAKDTETLFNVAKQALTQAKLRGKNRCHVVEPTTSFDTKTTPRVLIVDDEPRNIKLLKALLLSMDYEVLSAESGQHALAIVDNTDLDLILLDIMMPGIDGYEVCQRIKSDSVKRMIPIVMVTALNDLESKVKAIENGADDFITKPPSKMELLARTKSLIRTKKLNENLACTENVLFALANAVEAKDKYTESHTKRVSSIALALGVKLRLSQQEIESLKIAGILHDIGKIGVPDSILNKKGPLAKDEWEIIKTHTTIGHNICLPLEKTLGPALEAIRHHHEKLDGSGYPDGLIADEISLVSRIMAVADIFEALISDRPYRKGLSTKQAFDILREEADAGKIDTKIVNYLIEMIEAPG